MTLREQNINTCSIPQQTYKVGVYIVYTYSWYDVIRDENVLLFYIKTSPTENATISEYNWLASWRIYRVEGKGVIAPPLQPVLYTNIFVMI
jgi:hypothetical protein